MSSPSRLFARWRKAHWLFPFLSLLLVFAACSLPGEQVATVDDETIHMEDVDSLSAQTGTQDREVFEQDLFNAIAGELIQTKAEELFGIAHTETEIETEYQVVRDQIESEGFEYEQYLIDNGVTDHRIREIAHQRLLQTDITAVLLTELVITEEEIDLRIEQLTLELTSACLFHLLVETEEEAQALREQIATLEDFQALARVYSIDPSAPSNGGDLGCSSLNRYVPTFATGALLAPLQSTSNPVRSEFGYHLIWVVSRETEPADRDTIAESLRAEQRGNLYGMWLLDIFEEADIELDDNFGTWITEPLPGIESPS